MLTYSSMSLQMMTQRNQCPACLKPFTDPRWMPCKHVYCFKCIPSLQCSDLAAKDHIVLGCRVCARRHRFDDWSAVKYYATLHCVPYLTALQLEKTPAVSRRSSCPACFNVIGKASGDGPLAYCLHCDNHICQECLLAHRVTLKKNILHTMEQCRALIRRHDLHVEQMSSKLQNMKLRTGFCASELNDQVDAYRASLVAQIDEQKLHEETSSSSGYDSFTEQRFDETDWTTHQQSLVQKTVLLSEPTVIPIRLLGELISVNSDRSFLSTSQVLWTMKCSYRATHVIFESDSSKLFICSHRGDISVYTCGRSSLVLVHTFPLHYNGKSYPVVVKSLAACASCLIVVLNSPVESILDVYSHNGRILRSLSFTNEYISQIHVYSCTLWCLELISSSIFYYEVQPSDKGSIQLFERTQFIAFQRSLLCPFRFGVNQSFVAVMNRSPTSSILLFNKLTATYLRQIQSPSVDRPPCDFVLTNQTLIYRFSQEMIITQLDDEHNSERIETNKTVTVTVGRSDREFLLGSSGDDPNAFIIECYGQ